MRKVERTRHRLKRGALELFVHQGISETTTRQIAAACDMSEGNIYRHFPSKEELARELLHDEMVRLATGLRGAVAVDTPFKETVLALVRAYCRLAAEDWLGFSYHLRFQHEMLGDLTFDPQDDPVALIRDVVEAAMQAGVIPVRPVELVIGMGLGVVMQTALQILYGRLPEPLDDYADELAEAVWRVVGPVDAP
ncbi:TetR/AcrR family transcriptional regulator [Roseospira marina]|uniref:TetR/AcrR family transcriptional regulator n=1 Tax=Roseospira marina TaxID=140057 RepID=A0A5M6IAH5_9PROT|nr:TetR/AcrR family transcriptional regulator [Roseospira marina]KAA5605162.1 TetR/AcrR family transcriptional regulator [Roseospira marina]MBB4314919.1 AcrR family transcriptional regulator [Roseospira marina]MBB5087919.1 AcrR family transcriptional regulator [Roseospira marina]